MAAPQNKKIDIQVKGASAPLADAPLVDGFNLFTGDYKGTRGNAGFTTSAVSWEELWRFLGVPAPGPLPHGAQAVLEAESPHTGGVCYRPQKIVQKPDNGEICISWERAEVPADETVQKSSRYAVLVLPKGTLTAQFENTFPAQARRDLDKILTAQDDSILMGPPRPIRPLKTVRFKP